jgi:outer membrane protein
MFWYTTQENKMKPTSTLRGALVVLAAASLFAQQQTMQLSLAEAQRQAIQNNPQYAAAKLNAAAAYQVPIEFRANYAPTVTGSLTGVGADSGSRIAAGALNNPTVYSRFASGLTVNQMLTDFGRTRNLVDTAKLRAQAQDQVTETTRADILLATSRAYFAVLRATAVLQVAQQTVAARQLVSDQVTALEANRLKSMLDVSFANVNLSDSKLLVVQAQNEVKSAEAELAEAMGLPNQTAFVLSPEPLPGTLPDRIDPLIQDAIQNRPELKDLRLEQDAAERFVKAEHSLFYPTIAALGTAGFVPAGEDTVPGRYGAVGLNVNIPIFNGGLFKARQTEAELRAQAAKQNVNELANRIVRDLRVAYLAARTAYERIGLTDELLKQAQLALDLAQSRYNLGLSSIVELSQAQLNVTSAQIAAAGARYEYQSQWITVQFQTGVLH